MSRVLVLYLLTIAWLGSSCCCWAEGKARAATNGIAHGHKRTTLVPPPPPTTPVMGLLGTSVPIEMLSAKDLTIRRQEVEPELVQVRKKLTQQSEKLKERKERSELFASLYKEGVVSRKEYEGSCNEASETELEVKETLQKVSELEQGLARIDTRLAELTKSSAKPVSAGTGKK